MIFTMFGAALGCSLFDVHVVNPSDAAFLSDEYEVWAVVDCRHPRYDVFRTIVRFIGTDTLPPTC